MTDIPSPSFDEERTDYLKAVARGVLPERGDIGAYKALREAAAQRTHDEREDEIMWYEMYQPSRDWDGDESDMARWVIETDIFDRSTKWKLLNHWPPEEDALTELYFLRIEEKKRIRTMLIAILCEVRCESNELP